MEPLDMLSGLIKVLTPEGQSGLEKLRKDAIVDKFNGTTVDTVVAYDTGLWETAVDKGDGFVVVEDYDDKLQAKKGHKKWVKVMKADPEKELKDINIEAWENEGGSAN
jgi:hypothetical protein